MNTIDPKEVKAGDEVFVIYHNPHTATVANIKQAEIVPHPHDANKTALFLHETFHTIEDDDALFATEIDAANAYKQLYNVDYH
ncbi:transcriptional regulator SplA domain-containing protein [Bacillus tianshenii]|nr:transcriptional regulator SplA domain-containing protein [Bacillus tianshenii]